ncbi:Actin-related protein 10 [Erysiphe neolycopersici]|uniref:Actin-related protein 10 n=1 Tax=Erysiphe neolycopersici TaxID=212602 RepID=A0A420I6B2_9PEZI|nr:Actin-related protein 10 [Erysiphe neolycopersici]
MTHRTSLTAQNLHGSTVGPQTPSRNQATNFGSPSVLRAEEECIIIELGSRFVRVGAAGCALPQAVGDFGPEQQRRAGDLSRWASDYDSSNWPRPNGESWGKDYELWPLDLREVDFALVGDKIERALRDTFTKTLLIDSRPRRMLLAIPSLLPLPLLFTVIETIFSKFQPPSVSLMPTSILTTVAAGLRSALVIDIGWAETTVTSVYEFREVQCKKSIRASRKLGETVFNRISKIISNFKEEEISDSSKTQITFEECEEIIERMIWCKSINKLARTPYDGFLATVEEGDELNTSFESPSLTEEDPDSIVSLPLNSLKPPKIIQVPFSELSEPCEIALFATDIPESDLDDEELPLHLLIYKSLVKLPVDVRAICMARLVFVGGASQIPGLRTRVMEELSFLIKTRGWNQVTGKAVEKINEACTISRVQIRQRQPETNIIQHDTPIELTKSASLMSQESDPIIERLKRESKKTQHKIETGKLRAINSIGAWAGASLISLMKIQANAVIEKEQWTQNGASKFSILGETSLASPRKSMGPGTIRSTAVEERSSWTLGIWGH